jgi:predicted RNase H-like HicB family nuclease
MPFREVQFLAVYSRKAARSNQQPETAPRESGPHQEKVTVPLLPGLVTCGRTLGEAREMARDAIRCHIEGLLKDGDRIPDEKSARKEKLWIALSA